MSTIGIPSIKNLNGFNTVFSKYDCNKIKAKSTELLILINTLSGHQPKIHTSNDSMFSHFHLLSQ